MNSCGCESRSPRRSDHASGSRPSDEERAHRLHIQPQYRSVRRLRRPVHAVWTSIATVRAELSKPPSTGTPCRGQQRVAAARAASEHPGEYRSAPASCMPPSERAKHLRLRVRTRHSGSEMRRRSRSPERRWPPQRPQLSFSRISLPVIYFGGRGAAIARHPVYFTGSITTKRGHQ